jgi:hypothetical protein
MRTRPFTSTSTATGGLPFEEDWDILEEGEPDEPSDDPTTEDPSPPADKRSAALEAELKRIREQNRALKEAAKKREEEEAAKRGEFEALWKQEREQMAALRKDFEALSAKEQARQEALTAANEKALKTIPESHRGLIPAGLDPEAMASQIARVQALVAGSGPDGGVISKAPKPSTETIPEEARREADRLGMDHRKFFEKIYKPRMERRSKKG